MQESVMRLARGLKETSDQIQTPSCNAEKITAFHKTAAKEIAEIICSGIYTTNDPKTRKNLKETFLDFISNTVIAVMQEETSIARIRDTIVKPLTVYSDKLFEMATANSESINTFTATILQNLFDKKDKIIPKLLEDAIRQLKQQPEQLTVDNVMNLMLELLRALVTKKQDNLVSESHVDGDGDDSANAADSISKTTNVSTNEKQSSTFSIQVDSDNLDTRAFKEICERETARNEKFTVVVDKPSEKAAAVSCDEGFLLVAGEVNEELKKIDIRSIEISVVNALEKFLNDFKSDFKVKILDEIVNSQARSFINQPIIKIQILISILSVDDSDSRHMFTIGKKIFRDALTNYLNSINSNPRDKSPNNFMEYLDREFINAIAKDVGSSTDLPIEIIKSIEELASAVVSPVAASPEFKKQAVGGTKKSRNSKSKSKTKKSKKSKKSKTKKSRK